jgi:ATP-binding cassette subfamily F protein 3
LPDHSQKRHLRRGAKVLLDSASVTSTPAKRSAWSAATAPASPRLFALLNGNAARRCGDSTSPRNGAWPGGAGHARNRPERHRLRGAGRHPLLAAQQEVDEAEAGDDGDGAWPMPTWRPARRRGARRTAPRAQALILGLGFKTDRAGRPVNSFSGGWRMRLQLARALMCPSDLLLLDEPTNHLDLDALVWLEAWLQRYAGTMIVISHDREFLDAITNVTLHIDAAKLTRYGGNYSV